MKPFLFGLFATFFVLLFVAYFLGFYLGRISVQHAMDMQNDCGMRFFMPCKFDFERNTH